MKYIASYDPEYGWEVEPDDPSYDGPESNISDSLWTYHIEANTTEEAIKLAELEMAIDS